MLCVGSCAVNDHTDDGRYSLRSMISTRFKFVDTVRLTFSRSSLITHHRTAKTGGTLRGTSTNKQTNKKPAILV